MVLSQDLYCNVFFVNDYHKNNVTYFFIWILCMTIADIHKKVSISKSSQVLIREGKATFALPESYRRKKNQRSNIKK